MSADLDTWGLTVEDVAAEIPQDAGQISDTSYPVNNANLERYLQEGAAEVIAALGTSTLEGVGLEQVRARVLDFAVMRALDKMGIRGATQDPFRQRWEKAVALWRARPSTVSGVTRKRHRTSVPTDRGADDNYGRTFGSDYQW